MSEESRLEKTARVLCETLPFNLTVWEENGECNSQLTECQYCKQTNNLYECTKKNYVPLGPTLNPV